MKVICAGSRTVTEYDIVEKHLNGLKQKNKITEIVSGTANGADKLGEKWAKENKVPIKQFPADWDKYGKSAGPRRNEEMSIYADAAIIFMKGDSPGSTNMKNLMLKAKKPYILVEIN